MNLGNNEFMTEIAIFLTETYCCVSGRRPNSQYGLITICIKLSMHQIIGL